MKKLATLAAGLALILSACGGNANVLIVPTPDPTAAAPTAIELHQSPVVFPTGPYENPVTPFESPESIFTLTDKQQALFDAYSKGFNFDVAVFKGAAPIDVAQVYIECGNECLWEGEYNLFYFSDKVVSKAQYKAEFDDDMAKRDPRTRRDFANLLFPHLKDGKFVDEGNGSGYIEFDSYEVDGNYENLNKVKNRLRLKQVNDIWMIDINNLFEKVS